MLREKLLCLISAKRSSLVILRRTLVDQYKDDEIGMTSMAIELMKLGQVSFMHETGCSTNVKTEQRLISFRSLATF